MAQKLASKKAEDTRISGNSVLSFPSATNTSDTVIQSSLHRKKHPTNNNVRQAEVEDVPPVQILDLKQETQVPVWLHPGDIE